MMQWFRMRNDINNKKKEVQASNRSEAMKS